jgi:hypothetical protein
MGLGAAVLAHDQADIPLICPVTLLQNHNGNSVAFRPKKFPSARFLSIAFSRSSSARKMFLAGRSPSLAVSAAWLPLLTSRRTVELEVVGRLRLLNHASDVGVGVALGVNLSCRFGLADNLLSSVAATLLKGTSKFTRFASL